MKDENKETRKYRFFGFVMYLILRMILLTLKIKIIKSPKFKENIDNYIFCFWHNKLIVPSSTLTFVNKRAVLVSPSKDGELISVPLEKLGFLAVRGSSEKNPAASLISLMRLLKDGYNIGTPLDGPKGPMYVAKPGLIKVAQKMQIPLLAVGGGYSKKWTFSHSWDKFQVPKPFSTMVMIIGDPILIGKDVNIDDYPQIIGSEISKMDDLAEKEAKNN